MGDWPSNQIKFLYKNADGIISICQHAFRDVNEKYGLTHKNTKVIYNGIDTGMFSIQKESIRNKMRSKYNIKEDDIAPYAGRIHQSKGLDLIVEAFLNVIKIIKI